jgi:transcriptional regulator with XRE-family HTH domain
MDGQLAAEVGSRVRYHRLANGQTQEVVAGLAGITVDYLYQIERGRKVPALPVLVEVARVLRVEPSALLGPSRADGLPDFELASESRPRGRREHDGQRAVAATGARSSPSGLTKPAR